MITDTGYINTPNEAFHEFISESTLARLKEQIERDYAIIENILSDNNDYFENPNYIQYIVDILNNIDKLKDIIKTAGGNLVESRLKDCLDLFKSKWNGKIHKACNKVSKIEMRDCSVRSMTKKINEFAKIEEMMTKNKSVIEKSKYYKELTDINYLNQAIHSCFDKIYESIKQYLNVMVKAVRSDDEFVDTETEYENENKNDNDDIYNDDNNGDHEPNNYIYNDDDYDKLILLNIEKCRNIKLYKNDKYIKTKWKNFGKLIDEIMDELKQKCDIMSDRQALNANNVDKFIFIYSSLSKLQRIVQTKNVKLNASTIDRQTSVDENKDEKNDDDDSNVITIIKDSIDELKKNVQKNIKSICHSYSLIPMTVPLVINISGDDNNDNFNHVKINAILTTNTCQVIDDIDEKMTKREKRLNSFCEWINCLIENLSVNKNLNEISCLNDLQCWLINIKDMFIFSWLSDSCIEELQTCNKLLKDKQAESWDDVEKLLNECKSLRKIKDIEQNTSQEFFSTLQEFEYSKQNLAKKAEEFMDEMNNNDELNINYDKIFRIATQLRKAGCKNESSELSLLFKKINKHLEILQSKANSFTLSIEAIDELIKVETIMNELNTIREFADLMDNPANIKHGANKFYKLLNHMILVILTEIDIKYDLKKCSTQNTKQILNTLKSYLKLRGNNKQINNLNVYKDIIIPCSLPSLTQLINENEDKIKQLEQRNIEIDKIIENQGGMVVQEIEKYTKMIKRVKFILSNGDEDDLNDYLKKKGFKNKTELKVKLKEKEKELKTICTKEQEEKKNNENKMDKLNKVCEEIMKFVEIEDALKSLKVEIKLMIGYRRSDTCLKNKICELEDLLKEENQGYIFANNLDINNAYHTLQFLRKCKEIEWKPNQTNEEKKEDIINQNEMMMISKNYVNQINNNVLEYLTAYGNYLESNLNNLLIKELSITAMSKFDLNNKDFRDLKLNAISKLNDCLRVFRDISSFDHQIKLQQMDFVDKPKQKPLKLVAHLFKDYQIVANVDNYINIKLENHKQDILLNLDQWKHDQVEKLPMLHFISISMSSIDRYISLKQDHEQTYYRIASKIDAELNKFGDENTKQILPSFETRDWTALKHILETLQKAANVAKTGVAQRKYVEAVRKLLFVLKKLMAETKTRLLIDINKDNDVNDEKMLSLNDGLKAVNNLVETISPHLKEREQEEYLTVNKESKELGKLLEDRLKQLMNAALQSVKKRYFTQCEKRLDNISKLMEFNYQSYIPITYNTENDNDDDEGKSISVVAQQKLMNEQIDEELQKIKQEVKNANDALKECKFTAPYNKLRLKNLHSQLSKSDKESFATLWNDISGDILETITEILNQIKARNNQIEMENKYDGAIGYDAKVNNDKGKIMNYAKQQRFLQNIALSLSSFPTDLKQMVEVFLAETKKCASGNNQFLEASFAKSLEASLVYTHIYIYIYIYISSHTK